MIPTVQTCPPGAASFFWVCSVTRCHFCMLCLSILIYWLINCYNNQFMLPCWFEVVGDKFQHDQKKWIESPEFFVGQNGTIRIYPKASDLVVKPPLPAAEVSTVWVASNLLVAAMGANIVPGTRVMSHVPGFKCKDWNLGKPSWKRGLEKGVEMIFHYPGRFFRASWGWRGKNWLVMTREWNYTSVFFLRRNTRSCDPMLLLSSETNSETRLKTPCFVLPCQFFEPWGACPKNYFCPIPAGNASLLQWLGWWSPKKLANNFWSFFLLYVNSDGFAAIHVICRFGNCVQILPVWNSRHPKRTPKIFPGKNSRKWRFFLAPQESWILFPLKYEGWNPRGETPICWLSFYLGGAAMSCWWSLPRRNHSTTGWNFLWCCWLKFLQTVEGSSLYYIPLQFPMISGVCCRVLVIFPMYFMHLSAVWIGPPSALWHMYRYDITSGDRPRRVWLATIVDLDKKANARRQSCRAAESLRDFWNRWTQAFKIATFLIWDQGHFCPFGTENPRECSIFTSCRGDL